MRAATPRVVLNTVAAHIGRSFSAIRAALIVLSLGNLLGMLVLVMTFQPQVRTVTLAARLTGLADVAMLNQETGLRGFLLTGEKTYLEPYTIGRAALSASNVSLGQLNLDSAETADLINTRIAEAAWTNGWAATAASGAFTVATPTARLTAFLLRGKALFDAYRLQVGDLTQALGSQQDGATASESKALDGLIAFNLLLFSTISLFVVRHRDRIVKTVVEPIGSLLGVIYRITTGDVAEDASFAGPDELQEVVARLREMTAQLAARQGTILERESQLELFVERQALILDASREVAGSLNVRYITEAIGTAAEKIVSEAHVMVWLSNDDELVLRYDSSCGHGEEFSPQSRSLGVGRVGEAARFGRNVRSLRLQADDPDTSRLDRLAVPMIIGGRVVGVIDVTQTVGRAIERDTEQVLETLATHAASAVEAGRLHGEAERLSRTDPLTQLPNRRQLDHDLVVEVERAKRYGHPVVITMVDVDHFKEFNDKNGHTMGDVALSETARLLSERLRPSDTVYRYGGEEFVMLLRDSNATAAAALLERVRRSLEHGLEAKFPGASLTASFGAAEFVMGDDCQHLVDVADAAMYLAKSQGRNRIVLSDRQVGQHAQIARIDAERGGA